MKNVDIFPSKRNKYFYGKLMTVNDFDVEQLYINNKRRAINRFLHGVGVACGLNVVRVGDSNIAVESGLALDFVGREIIVERAIINNLSSIDGFKDFSNNKSKDSQYLYLCIEYNENEVEPVYSVAKSNVESNDTVDYGKYVESYRLFLTDEEPTATMMSPESFTNDTVVIFNGQGIKISRTIPKLVEKGGELIWETIVEKFGQGLPIKFEYSLNLTYVYGENNTNIINISFDESKEVYSNKYSIITKMVATNDSNVNCVMELKDDFSLYVGNSKVNTAVNLISKSKVVSSDLKRELIDEYYKIPLDKMLEDTMYQNIYLAKIFLFITAETCYINEIENMPFKQYIFNNFLSSALNQKQFKQNNILKQPKNTSIELIKTNEVKNHVKNQTCGYVTFDIPINADSKMKINSNEIVHGLGIGYVYISLGVELSKGTTNCIYFGNINAFENAPECIFGACVDTTRGIFTIGISVSDKMRLSQIRVHWIATKNKDTIKEELKKYIVTHPEKIYVPIWGKIDFDAMVYGIDTKDVEWSVKDIDGGTIDINGCYTAPGTEGTYQIVAQSVYDKDLVGTAYVVVSKAIKKTF